MATPNLRGERYSGEGEYRSDGRVNPVNPLGVSLTHAEHTKDNTEAENLTLQAEVKGLREMVDLYRERLADADWRYQELFEQLKTMTNALPAPQGTGPRAKRWWWPFR